jgi:hypothetical protein
MSFEKFAKAALRAAAKAHRESVKAEKKRQKEAERSEKIEMAKVKKMAREAIKAEKENQKQRAEWIESFKEQYKIKISVSPDHSSDWLDVHVA